MIATVEKYLTKVLPPPIVKRLQDFKAKLPTRLPQAPPIAVMYVNDGETRMFYEIVVAPGYTPEGLTVLKGKSKEEQKAWLGLFRPDPERVRSGKTVLVKITPM